MHTLTAILIAAIPTALYSMLIWWLDRWPPEVVPPGPLSEDGQPRPPAAPPSPPGDRRASEVLELWITSPDGIYYLTSSRADSRGRIGYSPGLLVQFGPQNPTGVYGYHYHGTQSNRQVDLYFTYNGR